MRQNKTARMLAGYVIGALALGCSMAGAMDGDGVFISATRLDGPWTWSARSVAISHKELREPLPNMPAGTSVLAYRIKYRTQNLKGESVVASGLVRVRSDMLLADTPIDMISYQHSTRVLRADAPSSNVVDPEAVGGVLYFASRGYLWAMPDYLGLGVNNDPQSYLHANGQASVCADFMLAVNEWAEGLEIKINPDVILMGYSQGGHTTLALQKFLESDQNDTPFAVRASFPMAGPYSVAGVGLSQALQSKSASQLLFVALALYGLSEDPALQVDMSQVINQKYSTILPKLLGGDMSFDKAAAELPKKATDFFSQEFLSSILTGEDQNPVLRALRQQDVIDYHPVAPVYLIHAPDDEVVPYQNSVLAQKQLKTKTNIVELIPLDKKLNHIQAALPAFSAAAAELENIKRKTDSQ